MTNSPKNIKYLLLGLEQITTLIFLQSRKWESAITQTTE